MEGQEMTQVVTELPPAAESVREARAMVRETARGLPRAVVEDAELLVSEVMSNAVQHGGPEVRLSLATSDVSLLVMVYDSGGGVPVVRNTGPEVPSGRGLRMVQHVAADWGVEPADGGGKTVWFRVTA